MVVQLTVERREELLDAIDGSGSDRESNAVRELRSLGPLFVEYLVKKYAAETHWKSRNSCVYNAIRYSRESRTAVSFGLVALGDRSKVVRHNACLLLAYSLDKTVLPQLRQAREDADLKTIEDITAAIQSIEEQNSNLFVDRKRSGKLTLRIL